MSFELCIVRVSHSILFHSKMSPFTPQSVSAPSSILHCSTFHCLTYLWVTPHVWQIGSFLMCLKSRYSDNRLWPPNYLCKSDHYFTLASRLWLSLGVYFHVDRIVAGIILLRRKLCQLQNVCTELAVDEVCRLDPNPVEEERWFQTLIVEILRCIDSNLMSLGTYKYL